MIESRNCKQCNGYILTAYPFDVCPTWQEINLFSDMKDFIRKNTVTEYDVAREFEIPLRKVKQWIKEGRIEYIEDSKKQTIVNNFCIYCKAPIVTEKICPDCNRKINSNKAVLKTPELNQKMRYKDIH